MGPDKLARSMGTAVPRSNVGLNPDPSIEETDVATEPPRNTRVEPHAPTTRQQFLGSLPWHRPPWDLAWVGNRTRRRGDAEISARTLRLSVSAGGLPSCIRRRPSVAPHGIGRRGNRLGEGIARGDAETRRYQQDLCVSASLRADHPHASGDAPRWPPMASAAVGMGLGRESHAETRRRGGAEISARSLRLSVSAGGSPSCIRRRPSVAPMASAAFGIGLRRESRAETRRRGEISKISAPQRLLGRITLMHQETPLGCPPWHRPLSESAWGGNRPRRRGDAEISARPLRLCVSAGGFASCTGTRSSVASHVIGRRGNGLGEEIARGDAETQRHQQDLCVSASRRADLTMAILNPMTFLARCAILSACVL